MDDYLSLGGTTPVAALVSNANEADDDVNATLVLRTSDADDDDAIDNRDSTDLWKLVVELILAVLIVFYVDFTFDILALRQFWLTHQYWFLSINAAAIMASVGLTFTELLECGKSFPMSFRECLLLGLAYPFQLHILFLVYLSILRKQVHPILVATKFAEAGIEALTSSLIQLYSIIFCHKAVPFATCELEGGALETMMLSVASSVCSVAIAFAMFDLAHYGASGFPGSVDSKVSLRYFTILLFRGAEITSRLLSMSMFQFITRPYGGWILCIFDGICIYALIYRCGGQFRYAIPCVFSLVNPVLEESNVLSITHRVYYGFRIAELIIMAFTAYFFEPANMKLIMTTYPHNFLGCILIISTVMWIVLVVVIRSLLVTFTMKQETYKWGRRKFTEIEYAVRDRMVNDDTELCESWLKKLGTRIQTIVDAIEEDAREKTNKFTDKARARIRGLLCCAVNVPSVLQSSPIANSSTKETSKSLSQELAQKLAEANPKFLRFKSDLDSVVWSLLSAASQCGYDVIFHVIIDKELAEVTEELLARYTVQILARFSKACEAGRIKSYAPAQTSIDEDTNQAQVLDEEGHPLNDANVVFAGDVHPAFQRCDECQGQTDKMWMCLPCEVSLCHACYTERRNQQIVHKEPDELDSLALEQDEAAELNQCIALLNNICRVVGVKGFKDISSAALQNVANYINSLPWDDKATAEDLRKNPQRRAGLELLSIMVRGQPSPPLHIMQAKVKVDFFDQLLRLYMEGTVLELGAVVVSSALAWFPAAAENTCPSAKFKASLLLAKFVPVAESTEMQQDDNVVIEDIIEYVTALGTGSVAAESELALNLKTMFTHQTQLGANPVKHELMALLYFLLQQEHIDNLAWNARVKDEAEGNFRRDLRKIQAEAMKGNLTGFSGKACTVESADAREKRNESFQKVGTVLKSIILNASSNLANFRESCRVSLAASLIQMVHTWTQAEQFIAEIKTSDMNAPLVELLCYACELALKSDQVGCDLILQQVFNVMHVFFNNPELKGGYGDVQCTETSCSIEEDTFGGWPKFIQEIRARVSQKLQVDDDRATVKRLVQIYTSESMMSSDNLLKQAIANKDAKLVWMLLPDVNDNGNKSLTDSEMITSLLGLLQEQGHFRPPKSDKELPSLLERCTAVFAKSRPNVMKKLTNAFFALLEMLPAGTYKDQAQGCIEKLCPLFERPDEMTFTLFRPWASPAGPKEKSGKASLQDIYALGKPIIGFFLTSW